MAKTKGMELDKKKEGLRWLKTSMEFVVEIITMTMRYGVVSKCKRPLKQLYPN